MTVMKGIQETSFSKLAEYLDVSQLKASSLLEENSPRSIIYIHINSAFLLYWMNIE